MLQNVDKWQLPKTQTLSRTLSIESQAQAQALYFEFKKMRSSMVMPNICHWDNAEGVAKNSTAKF